MKASSATSKKRDTGADTPSAASSSRAVERFQLQGPSAKLDPRYHAYRGDLADVALANRLFAPHYADAVVCGVVADRTPLHDAPSDQSEQLAELQRTDSFALLDITGGWAWGYRERDHLVGYVRADGLKQP